MYKLVDNLVNKIGFIGLGTMGKPMALNLLKAGYDLYVTDSSNKAVDEVVSNGAMGCKDAAEIAENVDIVITMLPNSKIVEAVLNGKGGFLEKAREGQIIIDMSTVSPHSTKAMAQIAGAKGVLYVDAPVSGGFVGAQKGTLTIMIGGEKETVDKVFPLFEAMGSKLYYLGDTGSGNSMKIVNNMLLGVNMAAVAEAIALAKKVGLDLNKMTEVIKESSGRSYAFEAKVEPFILKDNFEPGFAVDLQYKDLELALETAKMEKLPLPLASFGQQVYEMARAKGLGRKDIASLVKVWDDLSGGNDE